MQKLTASQINKILPADFSKHAARDISILSCSIFGESHALPMNKKFGANFSMIVWIAKGNQIVFYRSEGEYSDFSEKAGERCRKSLIYTEKLAKKLIEKTDWINQFLRENKNPEDLVVNNKKFFDQYRDFFAYHQAIYWASYYLSNLVLNKAEKKRINHILKILNFAYAYNEMVIPDVEKYFKDLKINHLFYDEVNKNVYKNIKSKPKNRHQFFIGKKRFVLSAKKAKELEKIAEKKSKKFCKNLKELKGVGVTKGIFKGRVNLVTKFEKLKDCKRSDVLVTMMTRPQFNKFIRQVGAIVTEEGGLLCHASILAREFKIPCVVGTKIATKVLKDGDLVEVDANKGVVRILK